MWNVFTFKNGIKNYESIDRYVWMVILSSIKSWRVLKLKTITLTDLIKSKINALNLYSYVGLLNFT